MGEVTFIILMVLIFFLFIGIVCSDYIIGFILNIYVNRLVKKYIKRKKERKLFNEKTLRLMKKSPSGYLFFKEIIQKVEPISLLFFFLQETNTLPLFFKDVFYRNRNISNMYFTYLFRRIELALSNSILVSSFDCRRYKDFWYTFLFNALIKQETYYYPYDNLNANSYFDYMFNSGISSVNYDIICKTYNKHNLSKIFIL